MAQEQTSIPSNRASRVAALAGAGAQVGVNYLKHYGRRVVGSEPATDTLHEQNADVVYDAFSKLKGGPLKLAQMLSIDKNMLPEAYRNQFAQAQYSAPPLSYPLVVKTFQREFGKKPLEIFDTFSKEAAHGASIGQVHRAAIGDKTFAVKVQYPGVADSLNSDLAIVKPIALRIMGMSERDFAPYITEVQKRLLEETDYELELKRSIELSKNSRSLKNIRFPDYYPEYSGKRVIVMDWIDGIPLDQYAENEASKEKRNQVAQSIWDFYHFQIHTLLRFHADPHPGNFLVDENNAVVALDFGCTKEITRQYRDDYFRFLDPALLEDREGFEAAMRKLDLILEEDSLQEIDLILHNAMLGTKLLGRPFYEKSFDFGDEDFMKSIYEFGERQRTDRDLKQMKTARGSPDSIYLNRAYFGLYSLMGLLRAEISARSPGTRESS
ncbi:MAG: AarF/ABC1/UbiB kinase family protein [Verrucomicrobiota bacterium]